MNPSLVAALAVRLPVALEEVLGPQLLVAVRAHEMLQLNYEKRYHTLATLVVIQGRASGCGWV